MIEQSVEFELSSWAIFVVEGPIEVLLLRGINQEIKLRNHDAAYDLFFIHDFDQNCLHWGWTHEGKMFVIPDWLAGLSIFALLGLEYLLTDGHPDWAVHLAEGASAAGELRSLEAEIYHIAFLLLEGSSEGHESDLFSIEVEEAS